MAPALLLPGTHSMTTVLGAHSATTAPAWHHGTTTALPTPAPAGCPGAPAVVTEPLVAQPQGTPQELRALSPRKPRAQCSARVPCPWVLLQRLRWHGKGTLRVTAPACQGWDGDCREGSTPAAGCTPGLRGTVPAPAAPSEPLVPWGTADVAAAAPSPSHYLVRAAARGLFLALHHFPANAAASLPLSCHAPPRTTILAPPRTCVCPHHAGPPRPPVPRVPAPCQPPASPPALPEQPITSHQGSWQ